MPGVSTRMKRTISQYRTGTLYNQKRAVCFRKSTSLVYPLPKCHQMGSALHILSGCQCPVIRSMVTERHDIASRMFLKVVGEDSSLNKSLTVLYLPTSLTPAFLTKLDAPPAAPMLS
eukprot:748-Pelagomonas_calceolata.AAC.2